MIRFLLLFHKENDPQGETMDAMIMALLKQRVQQRELARYLAKAFAETEASLVVARLILEALEPFLVRDVNVSAQDVARLDVHLEDDDTIRVVFRSLGQDFLAHLMDLTLSLQTDVPKTEIIRGLKYPPRHGVNHDPNRQLIYQRIFICAAAMASGSKVNPRASVVV